ncbi:MAG: hypothetical protein AAF990_24780, partial [Bacteroidota bacterium]
MKTTTYLLFASCIAILCSTKLQAQMAINSDGSLPDPSAMLDVSSTDKGFLIPRLTTAQRNNISHPATGLMVYDSDQKHFWYFNGTAWTSVAAASVFTTVNNTNKARNHNSDFIVGGNSLDYNGSNNYKMFFDKSLGALRAGKSTSSSWDENSRGRQSFASSLSSTASGQFSVAIGPSTTASESYTIAKGYKAEATSRNAVAIGSFAEA